MHLNDYALWPEFFSAMRQSQDAARRALDQNPLDPQDEVDWTYCAKQLERGMKFLGQAYDLARKNRDKRRQDWENGPAQKTTPPVEVPPQPGGAAG